MPMSFSVIYIKLYSEAEKIFNDALLGKVKLSV